MANRAPKLLHVQLRNDGDDLETSWAQDLGPAKGAAAGSRRVRLVNVPFLHAKPTWGDVIVVTPFDTEPFLMWDGRGLPLSKLEPLIAEDGGRYAMIVDYAPRRGTDGDAAFAAIARAGRGRAKQTIDADVVCERMTAPGGGEPGRVYLAVKDELEPADVLARFAAAKVPCTLTQIHPPLPKPKAAKTPKVAKAGAAKPQAAKATAAKARAAKPKAAKPRAAKPRAAKPRAAKPRAARPRAAKPKTATMPRKPAARPRKRAK